MNKEIVLSEDIKIVTYWVWEDSNVWEEHVIAQLLVHGEKIFELKSDTFELKEELQKAEDVLIEKIKKIFQEKELSKKYEKIALAFKKLEEVNNAMYDEKNAYYDKVLKMDASNAEKRFCEHLYNLLDTIFDLTRNFQEYVTHTNIAVPYDERKRQLPTPKELTTAILLFEEFFGKNYRVAIDTYESFTLNREERYRLTFSRRTGR